MILSPHGLLLLLIALVLAAEPAALAARPRLVASFDDDSGDAYGPGSYVPPGDSEITDADFDLRRFEVWIDGSDALLKVTLAAPFRQPGATARLGSVPLQLWNNIYYQNIDIYIDTDPMSAAGSWVGIPGRRIAFAGGRTWKVAVVMTPQPGPARGVTRSALGEAAARVIFPEDLRTVGRTITARVPVALLGGAPQRSWGYSVHVSGARWDRSFAAVDRLFHGKPQADAFTMPVLPVREAWSFGGAPEGNVHPQVIDVLLPPGADQKKVLGSFNVQTGAMARVPFVQLDATGPSQVAGRPPGATPPRTAAPGATKAPAPAAPTLRVVDVSDHLVTIAGPVAGIAPMAIGSVLAPDGTVLARVVVTKVLEEGIVARIVEGEGAGGIVKGAAVRF